MASGDTYAFYYSVIEGFDAVVEEKPIRSQA